MTTKTTEMVDVALDRISPNPWQPRTSMDPQYVAELAEDIHNVGLLQEPMARPPGDGVRYQLAFGHTRIEALRLLQESGRWGNSVLIKVEDLSDERMAYVALSENRARKQLAPMEEISAWAKDGELVWANMQGSMWGMRYSSPCYSGRSFLWLRPAPQQSRAHPDFQRSSPCFWQRPFPL